MGQIKVKDLMERAAKAGGPNFRKLKGWRDGYVVGISACVGSDCSRTQELAKELGTFGYEFIGPTISRWEGSEEQGFLVHAEVEGQVRHLIALGTVKYNQSDVYGWKLPLADTDIIIKTDSNGTELDGTMYEIVAPIALSVKDLELTKEITESTAPTYNAIRFISEEEKRVLESEGRVSHKGSFYSWNNRKVLYAFMVNNYYKVENYLPLVKVIERLLDSGYKYIVYLNLPNDGWTNRPYLTPYDLSLFDNLTEQEEKLLGVFDIDDSTYDTGPVYLAPEFRITAYTEDQVVAIEEIGGNIVMNSKKEVKVKDLRKKALLEASKGEGDLAFSEVAPIIAKSVANVEKIYIDEFGTHKFIVVEFKGGAINVRNIKGNSLIANLEELVKLLYGGYYREVEYYKQLKKDAPKTEVARIVKESKQKMYRDDIYDITANIIVQSIDIEDILKAIKNREKTAEDEQGSEGLWDLAFYETISQLEMDIWGADEEAYLYYMSTAEEVYDILVANIDNYKAGRRPVLVESKTINEGGENYWFQVMKEFNLSEEDIEKVVSNYRELLYKVYELREFASKNDLIAYSPIQPSLFTAIEDLTEVVKRINFQIESFKAFDLNKTKAEGKAIRKVKGAPINENNKLSAVGSEYFGEQATFLYVTNPNNPDDDILYEILITDVKGDDTFIVYLGDSGSRNLNQRALEEWIADELNDQRITGVHDGIKVLWVSLHYTQTQSFLDICYETEDGDQHLDTLFKADEDITDSFDPEDVKAMFKK